MANILTSYPIRYTQDKINSSAYGLITCNNSNYLDLTQADVVNGITFTTNPAPFPSSVNCRVIFNTGSEWFKLTSAGLAESIETQSISAESVLEEGNTISELSALTSIPAFENSQLRYAIALQTLDPENVKPQLKFTVNCQTTTQQLSQTVLSPEYEYSELIVINGVKYDSATASGGSITLQARYNDTESNAYTDWQNLNALIGVITDKIQFRAITTASSVGVSQSILNSIQVSYNEGGIIASSGGVSEIITVTRDWRTDLRHCRVVVRHSKLSESYIKCYVTFRSKSIKVSGEVLGVGTGQRQTLILAHTGGVKLDTVKVYYGGSETAASYDVNCQTGRIVLEAPEGIEITCDYEYGWASEEWQELELDYTESYDNYDQSVYRITLPENESGLIKSIAGIKLALHTQSGESTEGYFGTNDGVPARYKLRHSIKGGKIKLYDGTEEIREVSNRVNIDSEDSRYITVISYAGEQLKIWYEWESESPVVYELSGIFSK